MASQLTAISTRQPATGADSECVRAPGSPPLPSPLLLFPLPSTQPAPPLRRVGVEPCSDMRVSALVPANSRGRSCGGLGSCGGGGVGVGGVSTPGPGPLPACACSLSGAGRYHSSEHVVSRGVRVELTPHCRSTLDGMFNGNAEGEEGEEGSDATVQPPSESRQHVIPPTPPPPTTVTSTVHTAP